MNKHPNNIPADAPEAESILSKTEQQNTIAANEPIDNDAALTEAERMFKQGIGDNSHTDKNPS